MTGGPSSDGREERRRAHQGDAGGGHPRLEKVSEAILSLAFGGEERARGLEPPGEYARPCTVERTERVWRAIRPPGAGVE